MMSRGHRGDAAISPAAASVIFDIRGDGRQHAFRRAIAWFYIDDFRLMINRFIDRIYYFHRPLSPQCFMP